MKLQTTLLLSLLIIAANAGVVSAQGKLIENPFATDSSPDRYTISVQSEKSTPVIDNSPRTGTRISKRPTSAKPVVNPRPNYQTRGEIYPVSNQEAVEVEIAIQPEVVAIPDFMLAASNASDVSIDKPVPSDPYTNYAIYRDRNMFPTAPRKPCNRCSRPGETLPITNNSLPGFLGRPHIDTEPGGCKCGKKNCKCRKSMFSIYWPRPFSARLDERFPELAAARNAPCQRDRLIDCYDRLENFELINYTRTDNGYCGDFLGRNRDVYGCPGQTYFERQYIGGVTFRQPGIPVNPASQGRRRIRNSNSYAQQLWGLQQ